MASVDLGRLRVAAYGPYWWSWNFGPWLVEFSWRPPEPPDLTPAEEARLAEEKAKRDFELALYDLIRDEQQWETAQRLAALLAESRFVREITHSGGCAAAHAGCLAREVRDAVAKINAGGGGE